VAFSPDGRQVMSRSSFHLDYTFRFYDRDSGGLVRTFSVRVLTLAVRADGQRVLVNTFRDGLQLLDGTGKALRSFPKVTQRPKALAVSADGRRALVAWGTHELENGKMVAKESEVILLDVKSGRPLARLLGHTRLVEHLAFSPGGRFAYTGDYGSLRLWDLEKLVHIPAGKKIAADPAGSRSGAKGKSRKVVVVPGGSGPGLPGVLRGDKKIAFSADGRYALTAAGTEAQLWDTRTGKEVHRLKHEATVRSVAVSAKGAVALTGSGFAFYDKSKKLVRQDCAMRLWDLKTGKPIKTFPHQTGVSAVALSPDGKFALSGGGHTVVRDGVNVAEECAVWLWDLTKDKPLRRFEGHTNPVMAVAFSPDGRRVYSACVTNFFRCHQRHNGKLLNSLQLHVARMAFSPDGKRFLAGGVNDNKGVQLRDAGGKLLHTFSEVEGEVRALALTPDHRLGVVACGGWRMKDGQFERRNGRPVAEDGNIYLLDLARRRVLARLRERERILTSVAISPDGRYALAGDVDILRLWDLKKLPPVSFDK
jgi:WD40 repeat protein